MTPSPATHGNHPWPADLNGYDQGRKYHTALDSILTRQRRGSEPIEVVFVLGEEPTTRRKPPRQDRDRYIDNALEGIRCRYVLYDELIANTNNQYHEYLQASDKAKELEDLLNALPAQEPD